MIWSLLGFIIFPFLWKFSHTFEYEGGYGCYEWKPLRFPLYIWILLFFGSFIPILNLVLLAVLVLCLLLSLYIGDVRLMKTDSFMGKCCAFVGKIIKTLSTKL